MKSLPGQTPFQYYFDVEKKEDKQDDVDCLMFCGFACPTKEKREVKQIIHYRTCGFLSGANLIGLTTPSDKALPRGDRDKSSLGAL